VEVARRLVALGAEVASGRRDGTTVFVSGDESDGREALLRAVAAELRRGDPMVVAGRFELGNFEPWAEEADGARGASALQLLQTVVPLAETLLPVLKLFSLVLTQSAKAWQIVSQIRSRGGQIDPGLLLPQLLQLAAQERPVVCLVDCAEDAEAGWWEDLLTLFAGEIAGPVPVLLVVGIEAETQHDDVPRGQYAAQTLVQRGLARAWPLERIGQADLVAWIGRAEPEVFETLLDGSGGGRSALAARLWEAWRAGGVVERERDDRPWRFTKGGQAGIVAARLRRAAGGSLPELERAREVLSVAALEGRQFTAEAVAHALGSERDELVDYLDDVLVVGGLVEEVGLITIESEQGTQHLWRYRFVSDLDRLTLRHSLTDREAAERSERLADGLVEAYGVAGDIVSATLARLFDAGGDADMAASFWTKTRLGVDHDVVLWRASRLLEGPAPVTPLERDVAAELLVAAARLLYQGPFTDGLAYAQAALQHALEGSHGQGAAYYYSGWFRANLDQLAEARSDLAAALAIGSRLQRPAEIADATHQLANVDFLQGDYTTARRRYEDVLAVRRRLGDLAGVMTAREMLAELHHRNGDNEFARAELLNILEVERELGDLTREAGTLHRLGTLDYEAGKLEEARRLYGQMLDVANQEGNATNAGAALAGLGMVALTSDDLAGARDRFLEALRFAAGDPRFQVYLHRHLGQVELALGNAAGGRAHLERGLSIARTSGDAKAEGEILELIRDQGET
jgi:tetratricopeptide (TPR) repeat protein